MNSFGGRFHAVVCSKMCKMLETGLCKELARQTLILTVKQQNKKFNMFLTFAVHQCKKFMCSIPTRGISTSFLQVFHLLSTVRRLCQCVGVDSCSATFNSVYPTSYLRHPG